MGAKCVILVIKKYAFLSKMKGNVKYNLKSTGYNVHAFIFGRGTLATVQYILY